MVEALGIDVQRTFTIVFAIGGAVMAGLWRIIRLGNFSDYTRVGVILTVMGFLFGSVVALHFKFMPVGNLQKTGESL